MCSIEVKTQLTEELATYSWVDLCSHIARVARNTLNYYLRISPVLPLEILSWVGCPQDG